MVCVCVCVCGIGSSSFGVLPTRAYESIYSRPE